MVSPNTPCLFIPLVQHLVPGTQRPFQVMQTSKTLKKRKRKSLESLYGKGKKRQRKISWKKNARFLLLSQYPTFKKVAIIDDLVPTYKKKIQKLLSEHIVDAGIMEIIWNYTILSPCFGIS